MAKAKQEAAAETATVEEVVSKAVAVPDEAWAAFQAKAEASAARSSRPTPDGIRLNGNTGVFSRSKYNSETKETEFTDFEGSTFKGVVLAVRYFAKWKYKEHAKFDIRTREFSDFKTERIELVKRETVTGATPSSKFYDSYADFKDAVSIQDPESGDVKAPYDLWISVYALVAGDVIRLRAKGDSRGAWFDYQKTVKALPLVVTEFGVSDPIEMPARKGEEAKVYYHVTFKSLGDVPAEDRAAVMAAVSDMDFWFASFKQSQATPVASPAQEAVPALAAGRSDTEEDEIKIEDIPF